MTKKELLRAVARKSGRTQLDIDAILTAYGEVVVETLKDNTEDKVPALELGAFTVKHVAERSGYSNMIDGTPWTTPARDALVFKSTQALRNI